jgi:hypothetical protein
MRYEVLTAVTIKINVFCDAIWYICINVLMEPGASNFRTEEHSSTMKMDVAGFSETLVLIYQSKGQNITEDHYFAI